MSAREAVSDLALGPGERLHVLAGRPGRFQILRWSGAEWEEAARKRLRRDEHPIALAFHGDEATIIAGESVYRGILPSLERYEAPFGELAWSLQRSATAMEDGAVFFGRNQGEWGGGLVRWDGRMPYLVERRDSTGICDGPLNADCDPVTAVLADPTRPGCVVAAVGLRHLFMERGRLLRVCETAVEVLYEHPVEANVGSTHPMFGLALAPDGFWAITSTEILRFRWEAGEPKRIPIPELGARDSLWMSTDLPGLVVLGTTVNWTMSTSGAAPLIVSVPME